MSFLLFKHTFRQIWKNKTYSLIHFGGLATGIGVCLLLSLWVRDEWQYDRFNVHASRLYRCMWDGKMGDNEWKTTSVPMPLAGALEREFPEVEKASQVYTGGVTFLQGDQYVREKNVLFVDADFFDLFTVTMLAGDAQSTVSDPQAVLLTPETARRYFHETGPDYNALIGRTLTRNDGKPYRVGGIVSAFPEQSHLKFDLLASLKALPHLEERKDAWGFASVLTYFMLREGSDPAGFDTKLVAWTQANVEKDMPQAGGQNHSRFPFEAVTDIHLKPNLPYIRAFSIIGLFILGLACINFINLSTARALSRAREVGVRKSLGSSRWSLIGQFFGESAVYVGLASIAGIFLTGLFLPGFNELSGKHLTLDFSPASTLWPVMAALFLFTTLAAGAAPAWIMSAFSPSRVLKSGAVPQHSGKSRLRQGLVVFQFCISSALIAATWVVGRQMAFMQHKNLGFNQSQVLIIKAATALDRQYGGFMDQLRSLPFVEQVAAVQTLPGDVFDSTIFIPEQPSNYERTSLSYTHIDMNFIQTLQLKLAEGRDFNPDLKTDSAAFLINRIAARQLGWEHPVGRKLSYGGEPAGEVIGVVEDFNFASLHEEVKPLVMRISPWKLSNIAVRLRAGDLAQQVAAVQSAWKTQVHTVPFQYEFLDDNIGKLYEREMRTAVVLQVFTGLAVLIACLGLLGLAVYATRQRTKEIGIRKVMGASVAGITGMFALDFIKLVLIAVVLAVPLAYHFLQQWLEQFAFHTDIPWWIFAGAGLIATVVALATVGLQSMRAALANPVHSLRSE